MRKFLDRMTVKRAKLSGKRSGFTMVELLLVILIGGILIVAGVQGYNKIYLPTQADAEVKKVTFVLGGIERVKNSFNNGAYKAGTGLISANVQLTNALGGSTGTNDVKTWNYTCTAGANTNVVLTTENYTGTEKQQMIIAGINNNLSPWVATLAGTTIKITRANSVCN